MMMLNEQLSIFPYNDMKSGASDFFFGNYYQLIENDIFAKIFQNKTIPLVEKKKKKLYENKNLSFFFFFCF